MFLPNKDSFLLTRRLIVRPSFSVFLPNKDSFLLTRRPIVKLGVKPSFPVFSSPHQSAAADWCGGLPNSHSFLLVRSAISKPVIQSGIQESATSLPSSSSSDSGKPAISDKNKRTFLKVAGIAGAGLAVSLLSPKKASALIMGSSPTTGVVGVKDSTNTRINPATEETVASLLKPADLSFESGTGSSLKVKVTGDDSSSFSDSTNAVKKGLVDLTTRRVQTDVLSIPATASTENTLQTISSGGSKYTLLLETVGNYDYVGEAPPGSDTDVNVWRIKRIDSNDVGGNPSIIIKWANGSNGFGNIWDDRASGGTTYS